MVRKAFLSAFCITAAFAVSLGTASAQAPQSAGEFERGFGGGRGDFENNIEASTRDANGNRLIVNGRMILGQGSLSGGLTDGGSVLDNTGLYGVGNQLNVITQGSWNTVIIDSTQINNGDINVGQNGAQQ